MHERALYSIKETAEILGVSRSTVERRLADGTVPGVRIGARRLIPAAYIRSLNQASA